MRHGGRSTAKDVLVHDGAGIARRAGKGSLGAAGNHLHLPRLRRAAAERARTVSVRHRADMINP